MLESYYVRPQAVGRIRASWIGSEIECYVVWLAEQSYCRASVRCRVPVLFAFGEFAWWVVPGPLAIYQLMSRRS